MNYIYEIHIMDFCLSRTPKLILSFAQVKIFLPAKLCKLRGGL